MTNDFDDIYDIDDYDDYDDFDDLHFEVITGEDVEGSFLLSNVSSSGIGCGSFRLTMSLSEKMVI